jgi:hypothetical protein
MIEIRRCRKEDIDLIMDFIDSHWQSGHSLAVSRVLMDWQHGEVDSHYNYLIAVRKQSVLGILGYITSRRFDPALAQSNVIWLALWKVLDDVDVAGLGLRMLNTLTSIEPHSMIAVNGINTAHPPMYRALRYINGELKQFYVVNEHSERCLLNSPKEQNLPLPHKGLSRFVEMQEKDLIEFDLGLFAKNCANPKSPMYFINRFLSHPFYRYRVFQIVGSTHGPALLATRLAEHDGARALRIVDFAGDPKAISELGSAINDLMNEENAEYTDFWQLGLPDHYFEDSGFSLLDPDGDIVLPNYFEPFLQRNGRILCALKTQSSLPAVICRADGDQDRPNRIPEDVK